ncbi:MAG: hypothetical protein HRU28_01690 [Rhizobiales bacterium]|nr:hypothetical protein [Hyphomicrobiales bacterium]
MISALNFSDDEYISRSELAQCFLKMSVRTFERHRKHLFANGLPKPDTRFRAQKYHVGSIRKWIANGQSTPSSAKQSKTNTSDNLVDQFSNY